MERIDQFLWTEFPVLAGKPEVFSTEALLELDAICRTYATITTAEKTENTARLLDQIFSLWFPIQMPDQYSETFKFSFVNVKQSLYGNQNIESRQNIITVLGVIRILCNIAFFYPPSNVLNREYERREDAALTDYLPGIRFLNFLLAWSKIDLSQSDLEDMPASVEAKCRATMPDRYMGTKEIYRAWAGRFANGVGYPGVDSARADCCKIIIDAKGAENNRLLKERFNSLSFNMPLFIVKSDGGDHSQYLTPRAFDPNFVTSKLALKRDFALYKFFASLEKNFVCPFNKGGCSSRIASCAEPVGDLASLPLVPGCLVRDSLKEQRFHIETVEAS